MKYIVVYLYLKGGLKMLTIETRTTIKMVMLCNATCPVSVWKIDAMIFVCVLAHEPPHTIWWSMPLLGGACIFCSCNNNLTFMKLEAEGRLTRITFPAYGKGGWEFGVK